MSQKGLRVFVDGRTLTQRMQSPEPELQIHANKTSTSLKRRLSASCPPSGQSIDHMPHLVCCYGNRVGMALQRGIEVLRKKRVGWGQQRRTADSWHLLSVLVALKPQMHLVGGCSGNADGPQLPSTAACQSRSRIASCTSSTLQTLLLLLLSSQVGF